MSQVLLFLGAGASQPFEIPTMTKMVASFEEELQKNHDGKYFKFYSDIKSTLSEEYKQSDVDIESIFSVINGIASKIVPKDLGHLFFFIMKKSGASFSLSNEDVENGKYLKTELEKFIKKECGKDNLSNKRKGEIFGKSYDVLFKSLGLLKLGKQIDPVTKQEFYLNWRTFTTNYDLIFEDYWKDLFNIGGFFRTPSGTGSGQIYFEPTAPAENCLVKLHGSLDYLKLTNGRIMKLKPNEFTRLQTQGEMMLFPIQQKDLYLDPWITFFQHFKLSLKQIQNWVVVGYAFNDEFIREIFIEALTVPKRMYIISPHATELIQKFPQDKRQLIRAINMKFGDDNFQQNFLGNLQNAINA